MKPDSPPRLGQWFLGGFVGARDREELLGDLAEEFSLRAATGRHRSWYWGQVFRSIPAALWSSARRGRWFHLLPVALAAYMAAGILEFFVGQAIHRLFPLEGTPQTVANLFIGLGTLLAGGYIAGRVHRGAEVAMGVMVAIAAMALIAADAGHLPLWYGLAFLVAGPAASLAGGAFPIGREK